MLIVCIFSFVSWIKIRIARKDGNLKDVIFISTIEREYSPLSHKIFIRIITQFSTARNSRESPLSLDSLNPIIYKMSQ